MMPPSHPPVRPPSVPLFHPLESGTMEQGLKLPLTRPFGATSPTRGEVKVLSQLLSF